MSWNEIEVSGFTEFVTAIADVLPSGSSPDQAYWFRGQSNYAWPLTPSFLRSAELAARDMPEAVTLETQARESFQTKAHLFIQSHLLEKVKTTPCWWALMQHYQAPTRLLDWTASPYVAAYFAAQLDDDESVGAVWCFCSRQLRNRFETQHGMLPAFEAPDARAWFDDKLLTLAGKRTVIPLAFAYASSDRIVAQQGRFTMCFKLREPHDCIKDCIGPNSVRKILIPHSTKREFLLRLREMNITGSALFPGADGLGRSVRELLWLGDPERRHVARDPGRSRSRRREGETPSTSATRRVVTNIRQRAR